MGEKAVKTAAKVKQTAIQVLQDSPENLARAFHANKRAFKLVHGENVETVIQRLNTKTPIYKGILTNGQLDKRLIEWRANYGRAIGKALNLYDSKFGKSFTVADFKPYLQKLERQANSRKVTKTTRNGARRALNELTDIIENYSDGQLGLEALNTIKTRYNDELFGDTLGVTALTTLKEKTWKKQLTNTLRDFVSDRMDEALEAGAKGPKQVGNLLNYNGPDIIDVTDGMKPKGLFSWMPEGEAPKTWKEINQIYGDISTIGDILADFTAKSKVDPSGLILPSPFFGAPRFAYYVSRLGLTTPFARYVRHQVATGRFTQNMP